jgi:hypothetical protein
MMRRFPKLRNLAGLAATMLLGVAMFTVGTGPRPEARLSRCRPAAHTSKLSNPAVSASILARFAQLPLSFEPNQGQADSRVQFLSHAPAYSVLLTAGEAILVPRQRSAPRRAVSLRLEGVRAARPIAEQPLSGRVNYLIGNDPAQWRTDIPSYARVRYPEIYPGVDLVYYGSQQELEYDFVIAPGADPSHISFRLPAGSPARLDSSGDLLLGGKSGEFCLRKPLVYQSVSGQRREVRGRYSLDSALQVHFILGPYDHRRTLVIDPTLAYSTYLGSTGADLGLAIAVDSSGSAYIAGGTSSTMFPVLNAFQSDYGLGAQNAFISKLKSNGSGLVYSTYLGGDDNDSATGIAVDSSGSAYVTGFATSTNFPTLNPLQGALEGLVNAFVAKLSSSGSALVYSTFLGGSASDLGAGIAIDSSGNAYITGSATSTDFPTKSPFQSALAGRQNAFVSEMNSSGSALVFSTYLGGSAADQGVAISVGSGGTAYVSGTATSTNFPTQAPLQAALAGGSDAFVSEFGAGGTSLVYSTYLGGSDTDQAGGIAVDSGGDAFVAGNTSSPDFPVVNPFQPTLSSGSDAFVAKINAGGASLVFSTFLGGSGGDQAFAVSVDSSGNAYVTGQTRSPDFPILNAFMPSLGGVANSFIAKFAGDGTLGYSTYLGGNGLDAGYGIAADAGGDAFVTGSTTSTNFLLSGNVLQNFNAGDGDAFIAEISAAPGAGIQFSPTSLDFGTVTQGVASSPQTITVTDTGDAALTISSVKVTGTNSADFSESNTCSGSLAPGSNCAITIIFTPSIGGTEAAFITLNDNAPGSPQLVNIAGTGASSSPQVSLFPSIVVFMGTPVGSTSPPQTITLINNGSGPLTITSITVTGGAKKDFSETNDCGTSVPANGSCSIDVTFTPTVAGTRAASITIVDNAVPSTQIVGLIGGEDFSLVGAPPAEIVTAGQSTSYTITATPALGFNQAVTFSCSKPPTGVTCTFSPPSVTLDGTNTMNPPMSTAMTVVTTARGGVGPWRFPPGIAPGWMFSLFALALVALGVLLRQRRERLAFSCAFLLIIAAAGCGGGSSSNAGGTPAGTYNLTVDGTAGTLVESTVVSLTVN